MDDRRLLGHFGVGLVVGFMASLAVSLSLLIAISAVVIVVAVGFAMPRFAFLSGGLLGIGLTWFTLMMRSAAICRETEDYCGHANDLPMIVISLLLIGAGLLLGTITVAIWWRRRGRLGS